MPIYPSLLVGGISVPGLGSDASAVCKLDLWTQCAGGLGGERLMKRVRTHMRAVPQTRGAVTFLSQSRGYGPR